MIQASFFRIFSLFGGLNFEWFLGRIFGRILVRFWKGFWRIWGVVDAKKSTRSGGGGGGGGGDGLGVEKVAVDQ